MSEGAAGVHRGAASARPHGTDPLPAEEGAGRRPSPRSPSPNCRPQRLLRGTQAPQEPGRAAGCSCRLEGRQARRLPRPGSRLAAPGELLRTLQEPARLGCSELPAGRPQHLCSRASRAFGPRAQEPKRGAICWAPPDARAHAHPPSSLGSQATTDTQQRARAWLTPQEQDTRGAAGLGAADGTAATLWTGREGPARPSPQDTHGASERLENATPRKQIRGHPRQAHRQRASGHARAGPERGGNLLLGACPSGHPRGTQPDGRGWPGPRLLGPRPHGGVPLGAGRTRGTRAATQT